MAPIHLISEHRRAEGKMKRLLLAPPALAVLSIGANARDDRLPAHFIGASPSTPPIIWPSIVAVAVPIPTTLIVDNQSRLGQDAVVMGARLVAAATSKAIVLALGILHRFTYLRFMSQA